MTQILLWSGAGLAGLYLAVCLYALISRAIGRALLRGLRKTLSRESRALLSIQQETAHYERLLGELSEAGVALESGLPVFPDRRAVVSA